ncbi:MAG: mercuric reductase [Nitrospirae bacterium]|nr:MAG: mercuric reductase [Nitrospirota bacterium]
MASYDYDIGIIGGGAAGLTVAAGSAQLGAKTILINKDAKLGGDCLHYGCVPSKTLIKTAKVRHLMLNARSFGLPPVQLPAVDFRDISQRIRSVIEIIQRHDSPERFCGMGARVEFGHAEFADDHEVKIDGKAVSARNWVIATGSGPSIPSIPGLDKTNYLTNRELFFIDELPKSMVILGGGPIAVEMAQAFARLGTMITIVEIADQILAREDSDMAGLIMERLSSEGVLFHLNASVTEVRDSGGEKEVFVRKGNETLNVRTDSILVAAGRRANVDGLGLENAGVEFSKRGINVDKRLRTSRKHIYAAGDVTGAYQFTHAAGYEGGIVISNAIFHLPRKVDYSLFPWCTYSDPELASIGMNEKAAIASGKHYTAWTEEFRANDRAIAGGTEAGQIKMLLDEKERPLGVQILGQHAGDLIGEWITAMNGRINLSVMASSVHPYPTLSEINKKIAGNVFSRWIFSERMKKGLKLVFNFKGRACG